MRSGSAAPASGCSARRPTLSALGRAATRKWTPRGRGLRQGVVRAQEAGRAESLGFPAAFSSPSGDVVSPRPCISPGTAEAKGAATLKLPAELDPLGGTGLRRLGSEGSLFLARSARRPGAPHPPAHVPWRPGTSCRPPSYAGGATRVSAGLSMPSVIHPLVPSPSPCLNAATLEQASEIAPWSLATWLRASVSPDQERKQAGTRLRGVDWLDWPCGQNPGRKPAISRRAMARET